MINNKRKIIFYILFNFLTYFVKEMSVILRGTRQHWIKMYYLVIY